MQLIKDALEAGKTNFILIGGAGCGKSEIALNLALYLAGQSSKEVHLFDMDMTKPLFRSRDMLLSDELSSVSIHYEEQFFDAPTVVGGVRAFLSDPEKLVVMDVGGDDIGARSIGGFMLNADKASLCVLYVLNYFRPFCRDIRHIDRFLSEILAVSHLSIEDVHFVDNPNAGITTTIQEIREGAEGMNSLISEYRDIEMLCVHEDYMEALTKDIPETRIMPLHLFLTYEWLKTDERSID